MRFSEWLQLESNAKIVFASWSKDGTVVVYIDGKRYVYDTDAALHPRWKRMERFGPGRVLNEILSLIKAGKAQQIDPPPKVAQQASEPTYKQKNLF